MAKACAYSCHQCCFIDGFGEFRELCQQKLSTNQQLALLENRLIFVNENRTHPPYLADFIGRLRRTTKIGRFLMTDNRFLLANFVGWQNHSNKNWSFLLGFRETGHVRTLTQPIRSRSPGLGTWDHGDSVFITHEAWNWDKIVVLKWHTVTRLKCCIHCYRKVFCRMPPLLLWNGYLATVVCWCRQSRLEWVTTCCHSWSTCDVSKCF